MKKILTLLLSLVFAGSTLVYNLTSFSENVTRDLASDVVNRQVTQQINEVVMTIETIVPLNNTEAIEKLTEDLKNDKELESTITIYTKEIINDLVAGEVNESKNINSNVEKILLKHNKEFGNLMGDVINEEYKDTIVENVIKKIDFDHYYQEIINKVQTKIKPNHMKALKFINLYNNNIDLIESISLFSALSAFIFSLLINLSLKGFFNAIALNFGLSFLAHISTHYLMKTVLKDYLIRFNLTINYNLFVKIELITLIIFVVSFLISSLIRLNKKKPV